MRTSNRYPVVLLYYSGIELLAKKKYFFFVPFQGFFVCHCLFLFNLVTLIKDLTCLSCFIFIVLHWSPSCTLNVCYNLIRSCRTVTLFFFSFWRTAAGKESKTKPLSCLECRLLCSCVQLQERDQLSTLLKPRLAAVCTCFVIFSRLV